MTPEQLSQLIASNRDAVAALARRGYVCQEGPSGFPSVLVYYRPDEPHTDEYVGVWESPYLAAEDLERLLFPQSRTDATRRARHLLLFASDELAVWEGTPGLDPKPLAAQIVEAAGIAYRVGGVPTWPRQYGQFVG